MAFEYQNFASLAVNLNRQKYGPLDISNVFNSEADFKYYITKGAFTTDVSSYWLDTVPYPYDGQVVAVVAGGDVKVYVLIDTSGAEATYKEVGSATEGDNGSIELNDGTLSIKDFGKKYYRYVAPVNEGEEAAWAETAGFKDGLEPKVKEVSTGVYEIRWYEPNPTTVEGLQSALTTLSDTVNNETTGLTALGTRLGALESAVNDENNGLGALSTNVETLSTNLGNAQSNIEHLATLITCLAGDDLVEFVPGSQSDSQPTIREIAAAEAASAATSAIGTLIGDGGLTDENLDTLVEIVEYIKANDTTDIVADVASIKDVINGTPEDTENSIPAVPGLIETVSGINSTVSSINSSLTTINGSITTINRNISGLDGRLTTAEGKITTLEGKVSTLEGQVITNTSNIATNTSNIATNTSDIAALKDALSWKEFVEQGAE